ncbi:DUF1186 domain-containing protein [Desulfobulbus alkaliphilus]|uniref:DUF1186 domain-containing protein n=1 Tax=Desulfobulbus alkaliphilus TaxID=869814 RepID=UPI0019665B0D|nr:DUF1186 domain-containing protein [Desulfobulbus alkaliphilus]MBM9536312.1 DUF1186 domain-containing protein [Desulfobulbus alkaliphilus]
MEINDILQAFEIYDKEYKRDAIDAAIARREEITPDLIGILDNVLKNPEHYADRDCNYFAHIYAFILLGYFKESGAHDVIVDLASLSGDLPSLLLGDSITGDLPIVLLRTCGGRIDRIKELILNKDAYEYCRGSALQALSYAVVEGYATREEVLSFYQELFTGDEATASSCFHDTLAVCIYDLYPEELMEAIGKAYEEGLIHPGYVRYEEFTEVLKTDKANHLEKFRIRVERNHINDIHQHMSWWACFQQPEKSQPHFSSTNTSKNKAKKSRKKQTKQSKKANRGKK